MAEIQIDLTHLWNNIRPYAIAMERSRDLMEMFPGSRESQLEGRVFTNTLLEVASRLGVTPEQCGDKYIDDLKFVGNLIVDLMPDIFPTLHKLQTGRNKVC